MAIAFAQLELELEALLDLSGTKHVLIVPLFAMAVSSYLNQTHALIKTL